MRLALHHSPVDRCRETAIGIRDGHGEPLGDPSVVEDLAAPFVVDKLKAYKLVLSRGPRFIRDWFDDQLPADAFMPREQAALGQIAAIESTLREDAVSVCVTHDWNIALLKQHVLALSPEQGWPQYLDGLVLARDGEGTLLEIDGRVGRV
jgi:hypothetical protein